MGIYASFESSRQSPNYAGPVEAGVQGVPRHTHFLAAFFHKLSGEKKILKIGQNLIELEEKSLMGHCKVGLCESNNTVVCKVYSTAFSFPSISQNIMKVSRHAILYNKEAL